MNKHTLGPKAVLYPMPTVLVGANVEGKPNFITIAYCGILSGTPPIIYVSIYGTKKKTSLGITENGTFSVNIPSVEMVTITDYVGIYSGHTVDKSTLFETFYGQLKTAPMITDCPLNLECKLIDAPTYGTHTVFIGEITEVYTQERFLTDNTPDITKINPIVYATGTKTYHQVGQLIAHAFSIGKQLKSNIQ